MRQKKKLIMLFLKLHAIEIHIYTFFELCLELFQDKVAQFDVGRLQVMIVDHDVEVTWRRSVLEFNSGRVQALCKTLLCFCVSLSQALLQLFD